MPGVATGLSWTPVGGEVLFIEATSMPGNKGFQLTGSLGDVMQESAHAALSYLKSRSREFELPSDIFDQVDIHIHIPEGAIPKDGPSAGITIATALASAFTGRPVRRDVGMTGEITLRGRVLPVGGLKEKSMAAHRAGIKTIIVPRRNQKDMVDIPKKIQRDLKFVFVDRMDGVLPVALISGTLKGQPIPGGGKPLMNANGH